MRKIITAIVLLGSFLLSGQSLIKGNVSEYNTNEPIDNAVIILYNQQNNNIIAYKSSDEAGNFSFENLMPEQAYRIEASKMGYHKRTQQIILAQDSELSTVIKFKLPPKSIDLEAVTIEANRPIIIKKDTIIYNIEKLTDLHDSSLEDVLSKIRGVEIAPDGSLSIQGKNIRKVLVDGKEISDFGAGLLTKSIPAEKVESVEVRFDEKNKKIKESLLSKETFSILDIKLKGDKKSSFFGKARLSTGYQQQNHWGGYANLFSLNKKANIQLFGESQNYGKNKIEMSYIKNIGQEAINQMLSTPIDIDDLKKRQTFKSEMYGFNSDYSDNDKAIVGTSINIPLSEQTDFYIGSFAGYSYINGYSKKQLFYADTLISYQSERQFNLEYNTKSKIQLKHTSENFKNNADVNFVSLNATNANKAFSHFERKDASYSFYANNSLEYLFTPKIGLTHKLNFSFEDLNIHTYLNNPTASMLHYTGEKFSQKILK